jgi:uncharacterized Zn finger protein
MPHSVLEVLKSITLKSLALPSNLTYGQAIFDRGAVEIVKTSEAEIEAWAGGLTGNVKSGGGSKRHVWFRVKADQLVSHCSGNPKNHDIFCKHCVAVALKVLASHH